MPAGAARLGPLCHAVHTGGGVSGTWGLLFSPAATLHCIAQLVCDWAGLRSIYNAVYMLGLLVGSFVFGWFSDRHGRVPGTALYWCNCTVLRCQP